jgi:hypothetical protein
MKAGMNIIFTIILLSFYRAFNKQKRYAYFRRFLENRVWVWWVPERDKNHVYREHLQRPPRAVKAFSIRMQNKAGVWALF